MRQRAKRVWFLACPGTGSLNLSNPWEVLGHTNDLLGYTAYTLELFGPHGPALTTGHGLVFAGVRSLPRRIARYPEVAVVAGFSPRLPLSEAETKLVAWLRRHGAGISKLVSICTGAFALGEAGLLDGRRATTHWQHLTDLRSRFPRAQVVDDSIYVRDGSVFTSAGLTAGVDLTLAMVEGDHGHAVAMAVAKRMVLFLRRSGHQAQFSSTLRRQARQPPKSFDLESFVLEHLEEPLPVARIAAGVGMSSRSLSRFCREHLDASPARVVRRIRIDEARRLLEETTLPLKDITARAGLGDVTTMWRLFARELGVTPSEYRERFAAL